MKTSIYLITFLFSFTLNAQTSGKKAQHSVGRVGITREVPSQSSPPVPRAENAATDRGPIRLVTMMSGNFDQVPSRLLYGDDLGYRVQSNSVCAHFDATDEISAEKSFSATGESVPCHDGARSVAVSVGTLFPMASTRGSGSTDAISADWRSSTPWTPTGGVGLSGTQSVKISFERLFKGGVGMRVKMQLGLADRDGVTLMNSVTPMALTSPGFLTYEGDFYVKSCENPDGSVRELSTPQFKSVSDILAAKDESMKAPYVRCRFVATKMTTADVPFWRKGSGEIFPTLYGVQLTLHPYYANISFAALNGLKFGGERIRAVRDQSASVNSTLLVSAQRLITLLNGAVSEIVVSSDKQQQLTGVLGYLQIHRSEIRTLLADIDQKMQDPDTPFDEVLNVALSLNHAYQFLDQAVGLVSDSVTFSQLIEISK